MGYLPAYLHAFKYLQLNLLIFPIFDMNALVGPLPGRFIQ